MKLLILLTWMSFVLSSDICSIFNDYEYGDTLFIICGRTVNLANPSDSVRCELNELNKLSDVLRGNIVSIRIEGCPFNEFHLFPNCTSLYLDRDERESIKRETFIEMKKLQYIIFAGSTVLDASAFSQLTQLRHVVIGGHVRNMNRLAFEGAHQLKLLDIQRSHGSSFPPEFFHDLTDLEWLSFRKFGMAESLNLSAIDFTGLENLKWLTISFPISNPAGNWSHILTNLRYSVLGGNYIDNIDSITFSQMQNLIVLNLEDNYINQLNASTFSGLTNLRTLILDRNPINHIENGTFLHLKRLKKLDLSSNKLSALDEFTFTGLESLQYLSLQGNLISNINVNTFSALTKLVQLDMSHQYGLLTIDLNAFPQFIDLQTKSVVPTEINSELDDFESGELQWLNEILSYSKGSHTVNKAHSILFGHLPLNENQYRQIDLHNLTHNIYTRPITNFRPFGFIE